MTLAQLVGLAAGSGAVTRYVLDSLVQQQHDSALPLGTLAVNVTGSLLLGFVIGLGLHHGLPTMPTVILSAGFSSGYTTWSTFTYETLALVHSGSALRGVLNVVGGVAAGLAAAAAGFGLALL